MDTRQVLEELLSIASPSSYEHLLRARIKSMLQPYADKVVEDVRGNLMCYRYASNAQCAPKIAFVAHMDQIGMIVTYVEDSGLIRFATIGGIDTQLLKGRMIQIIHKDTIIYGVVGSIPVHMRKDNDRKELDINELWIDIGTKSKNETLSKVAIGDPIAWYSPNIVLNEDIVTGCSCDNKAGVVALIKTLEKIHYSKLDCNYIFVFTSQEEVGSRGVSTAIQMLKPDISIVVDVGHATDYPHIKKSKYGNILVGDGCIIPFGVGINREIQDDLVKVCSSNSIKYQNYAVSEPSGTDASMIEKIGIDSAIGLVQIPCKYMHSPIETVSISDIDSVSNLFVSYCTKQDSCII